MTAIISNADLYVQDSISSFHLGVPQALPTQHFKKVKSLCHSLLSLIITHSEEICSAILVLSLG